MGKIGLAVTPADPSLVYATIEAGEEKHGFYRSRDRGERGRYAHRPELLGVAAVLVELDLALSLHDLREDCVDPPVQGR